MHPTKMANRGTQVMVGLGGLERKSKIITSVYMDPEGGTSSLSFSTRKSKSSIFYELQKKNGELIFMDQYAGGVKGTGGKLFHTAGTSTSHHITAVSVGGEPLSAGNRRKYEKSLVSVMSELHKRRFLQGDSTPSTGSDTGELSQWPKLKTSLPKFPLSIDAAIRSVAGGMASHATDPGMEKGEHVSKRKGGRLIESSKKRMKHARKFQDPDKKYGGKNETQAQRDGSFGGKNETKAQRDGKIGGKNETKAQMDTKFGSKNLTKAQREGRVKGAAKSVALRQLCEVKKGGEFSVCTKCEMRSLNLSQFGKHYTPSGICGEFEHLEALRKIERGELIDSEGMPCGHYGV